VIEPKRALGADDVVSVPRAPFVDGGVKICMFMPSPMAGMAIQMVPKATTAYADLLPAAD
jgi:hypothetical protein